MSDERLRRAARQLQSGDPAAEERLLRERLRAGGLDPERLRLAAFLGHGPARALDPDAPRPPELARAWEEVQARARGRGPGSAVAAAGLVQRLAASLHARTWCEALAGLGQEPLLRAGHLALGEVARALPAGAGPQVERPLAAVEAWLARPDAARAAACLSVAEAQSVRVDGLPVGLPDPDDPQALLAQAATLLAYAVEALVPASAAQGVATALVTASRALRLARGEPPDPPPPADAPALPSALAELLERARARLLAWALA